MLAKGKIAYRFWKEVVHATVYIQNKCLIRPNENEIPYEIWFGRKANVKRFKIFDNKCYIKRTEDNLGKFEDKADEGIFIGYLSKSKAFRCYNKRLEKIVESVDVRVDEGIDSLDNNQANYPNYEEMIEGYEHEESE